MESEPVAETFFIQNKMMEKCKKCVTVYKKLMSATIIWFGYYHRLVNYYSSSVVIDCNIITNKFQHSFMLIRLNFSLMSRRVGLLSPGYDDE